MKIELVKLESEWVQSTLGCYLSLNNTLIDVITPINTLHDQNTLEISNQGILRLVIRDMGKTDGYLGSVSIPVPLLNSTQSPLVLPLFDSPSSDLLQTIPSNFEPPCLTLRCLNDCSDDEIFLPQNEEKSENKSKIVLASKFSISYDNEEQFIKTSNFSQTGGKKVEGLEIFQVELEMAREELGKEKEKNRVLEERYSELMEKFKENAFRAQNRENSLLDLIGEKEEWVNKNLEINMELQNNIRNSAFENKMMRGKVEQYQKQEEYVKQLETELKKYQELLISSEKTKDELTSTLIEFTQNEQNFELSYNSLKQFSTPRVLTERNFQSTEKNLHTPEPEDTFIKSIQKALPKAFSGQKIKKINDFVYKIGDFQVKLAISEDGVWSKTNTGLVPLADYLLKLTHKGKTQPFTPENEPKQPKGFLKLTESSINRLKNSNSRSLSRNSKSFPIKKT